MFKFISYMKNIKNLSKYISIHIQYIINIITFNITSCKLHCPLETKLENRVFKKSLFLITY